MISLVDVAVVMTTPLHVQEIFSEVVERKADSEALQSKLTFSFDDLNRKLSIRQDSVFKVSIVLQSVLYCCTVCLYNNYCNAISNLDMCPSVRPLPLSRCWCPSRRESWRTLRGDWEMWRRSWKRRRETISRHTLNCSLTRYTHTHTHTHTTLLTGVA